MFLLIEIMNVYGTTERIRAVAEEFMVPRERIRAVAEEYHGSGGDVGMTTS